MSCQSVLNMALCQLKAEAGLLKHSLKYFRMLIKTQIHKLAERRPQVQAEFVSLVLP